VVEHLRLYQTLGSLVNHGEPGLRADANGRPPLHMVLRYTHGDRRRHQYVGVQAFGRTLGYPQRGRRVLGDGEVFEVLFNTTQCQYGRPVMTAVTALSKLLARQGLDTNVVVPRHFEHLPVQLESVIVWLGAPLSIVAVQIPV